MHKKSWKAPNVLLFPANASLRYILAKNKKKVNVLAPILLAFEMKKEIVPCVVLQLVLRQHLPQLKSGECQNDLESVPARLTLYLSL